MTDDRINYTSSMIVDTYTSGVFAPAWTPVVEKSFKTIVVNGVRVEFNENFIDRYTPEELATIAFYTYKLIATDGTVTFADDTAGITEGTRVAYRYDNITIPQNDLPQLTAHMEGIELAAKARRIAIYFSQMAAFQAKTEMGIDLGEVLATQACAELSYEIDTDVVKTLVNNAKHYADLDWSKKLPVGVSKRDHYAGFAEITEIGSQHIYDATQKHAANYMVCSSSIKPVLVLMEGFKAASTSKINGPYYAGELNGVKVYISPAMKVGEYILGYNGGDMVTSAAVYAPYMAIVPTQLLSFADGAMSQGFSTLYDLKMLNPMLLVKGFVKND